MTKKDADKNFADIYREAERLIDTEGLSIVDTARKLNIQYNTLYTAIRRGHCRPKSSTVGIHSWNKPSSIFTFEPLSSTITAKKGTVEIQFTKEEFVISATAILNMLENLEYVKGV